MFAPNDDQQLLVDSARRFTQKHYADDKLGQMGENPLNTALWSEMAEAGWLMLPFAEADGGLQPEGQSGLGDCVSLFEVLGEGLVVEPVLASTILAGGLIAAAPASQQRADLIEGIVSGGAPIGVALHEPRARHDIWYCETRAEKSGDGWTLSGVKSLAHGAAAAETIIVLARIEGDPAPADHGGADGLGVFLVPADAQGVTVTPYRLRDDHWVADVALEGVRVGSEALLLGPGDAAEALEAVIDKARLLLAAEGTGIMRRLCLATQQYTADRKQFGVALASFQVLQHRMVDMSISFDQARSLVYEAVTHDLAGNQAEMVRAARAAYRAVSEDGVEVGKQAIQLHGGMGMSEELPMGRALRRLLAIRQAFPL
ncbi:acyl-CoA dehydrogenase family protein [Blastomonas aquatica]|uniref:Pimeloyl-CoA dehydrogenase small subunit n=1 Tax=Blastomonas aquatica TaxID=1510276 RepID=A0ABQ1IUK0_9SPHN|nr:acyl-CoA dehydrogenase [Blastomonas aquatica]GGB52175.1 pimeloyl-CoA dehydrogenase small subunit [Blastomonas aquatica]